MRQMSPKTCSLLTQPPIRGDDKLIHPRWHVVHTHKGKERYVELNLNRVGLDTLLPLVHRGNPGPTAREIAPLFPQYLFVYFDAMMSWRKVSFTSGVDAIVSFGGVPATVEESVIEALRRRPEAGCDLAAHDDVACGDSVHLVSGPFKDLSGVIERHIPSRQRVLVLLEYLSGHIHIEVPSDSVAKREY
jgi:transcriptional antiterminator RfaH